MQKNKNNNLIETPCRICGKTFPRKPLNTRPENWICDDCKIISKRLALNIRLENAKKLNLEKQNFNSYICEVCGNKFFEDFRTDLKTIRKNKPRFCSKSCARKFSFSKILKTKKEAKCIKCNKVSLINIHRSSRNYVCEDCKRNKKELLKNHYRYSAGCILGNFERSQAFKQRSNNLIKLGFNFENDNWEEEFFSIRNTLYNLYYENKLSSLEISKNFDFSNNRVFFDMYKLFGFFKFRKIKESAKISSLKKETPKAEIKGKSNYAYLYGYYINKLGNIFYYRSSYELATIKYLEDKNIKCELNKSHIVYRSSKDNSLHSGYPDFYLPDYNLFVEIKSTYNYDEKDLIDRYEEIRKSNNDFIIITCLGHYRKSHGLSEGLYDNNIILKKSERTFYLCGFRVLKSFIEDREKEEKILEIFDIKNL